MNKHNEKIINKFASVMTKAINDNVVTKDDMFNSPYISSFWIATNNLAAFIVNNNYSKGKKLCKANSWDKEDLINELMLVIINKYGTQAKAIMNPQVDENGSVEEHNYNAYNTKIYNNYVNSELRRLGITDKKKNTPKGSYQDNLSIYMPITEKRDGPTLGDTIGCTDYSISPERTILIDELASEVVEKRKSDYNNRLSRYYSNFKHLANKKYLAQAWWYMEEMMESEKGITSSLTVIHALYDNLENKTPGFQDAARKMLYKIYNRDLEAFVRYVNKGTLTEDDLEFIHKHTAKGIENFGKDFKLGKANFYRLKSRNKKELAKIDSTYKESYEEYLDE